MICSLHFSIFIFEIIIIIQLFIFLLTFSLLPLSLSFPLLFPHTQGPQVDWDPDIIAALDDDDKDNDKENDDTLEDDFILQVSLRPFDSPINIKIG